MRGIRVGGGLENRRLTSRNFLVDCLLPEVIPSVVERLAREQEIRFGANEIIAKTPSLAPAVL